LRICIYGAGAVGGFTGALLARAGHEITVVARGAHLEAMRDNGLTLVTARERFTVPVRTAATPEEAGVHDAVLMTLKGPSLAEVAGTLGPLLGPETPVIAALNGIPWWFFSGIGGEHEGRPLAALDPDGRIAGGIPIERVIGCVLYVAAEVTAPGVITHTIGGRYILGEPKAGLTPRVEKLAAALNVPGLEVKASPAIRTDIFHKLIGNMAGNTVSALTHATAKEMYDDLPVRKVTGDMVAEGIAVASRFGIAIPGTVEDRLVTMSRLGDFKSSTLQDVERRRPLEVDGLILVVQELARLVGVATPTIDVVAALIAQRAKTLLRSLPQR
jgi:2-dehydropantoate 2-reductase